MGVPERGEGRVEGIFEKIMAKKFSKYITHQAIDVMIHINPK